MFVLLKGRLPLILFSLLLRPEEVKGLNPTSEFVATLEAQTECINQAGAALNPSLPALSAAERHNGPWSDGPV